MNPAAIFVVHVTFPLNTEPVIDAFELFNTYYAYPPTIPNELFMDRDTVHYYIIKVE